MNDEPVLAEKLEALRRCLERVRTKMPPSPEALKADIDAQDIVSVNLERAVQASVDITLHILSTTNSPAPRTMAEAFLALANGGRLSRPVAERMVKAVGFRNIAVHAYRSLDWDVVFQIGTRHLDDFRDFMREAVPS
ncbi:MAG: type VII toxin-antitoxin system HepT family RNase toxin [Myxococcaceae bacterium]